MDRTDLTPEDENARLWVWLDKLGIPYEISTRPHCVAREQLQDPNRFTSEQVQRIREAVKRDWPFRRPQ